MVAGMIAPQSIPNVALSTADSQYTRPSQAGIMKEIQSQYLILNSFAPGELAAEAGSSDKAS